MLLRLVPADGESIGNVTLMRTLAWDEETFWEVRNRLVDHGRLELGRGRGGSVRLVRQPPSSSGSTMHSPSDCVPAAEIKEFLQEQATEASLYEPLAVLIRDKWVKDIRVEQAIVHVTGRQGSRQTGGRWSRPDITVATLSTFPYVPGRHFDVITFEVKTSESVDVTAVYEALAHLRSATKAYALFHVPENQLLDLEEQLIEVCGEAKQHGIGVVIVGRCDDYDTWDERVEPVRREPEPRKLNDFLAKQLTDDQRELLLKWFK